MFHDETIGVFKVSVVLVKLVLLKAGVRIRVTLGIYPG